MKRRVLFAVVAVALVLVGVGAWLVAGTDGRKAGNVTIDERTGAYRGVRFGTSEPGVIRVLGQPDRSPGFASAGENPSQVGVPESIPGGRGGLLKYKGVGFLVTHESRVYAFIVTEPGATTKGGVSIGDSMEKAWRRYPLACTDVAGGESLLGGRKFYQSCGAQLKGGVHIWFGRDPIRSITLVSVRPPATEPKLARAHSLFQSCKVKQTVSLHNGTFYLTLRDGTRIDLPKRLETAINAEIAQSPLRCAPMTAVME